MVVKVQGQLCSAIFGSLIIQGHRSLGDATTLFGVEIFRNVHINVPELQIIISLSVFCLIEEKKQLVVVVGSHSNVEHLGSKILAYDLLVSLKNRVLHTATSDSSCHRSRAGEVGI